VFNQTGEMQMDELENWPGSVVNKLMLVGEIGKFLRTHDGGGKLLMDWLESVPPTRTEAEFQELIATAAAEHEQGMQNWFDEHNKHRVAQGLPAIDRKGNLI
jgi:hypothetical protein